MALDTILIGSRITYIREKMLNENKTTFAERCNLSLRTLASIERGDGLMLLSNLDKISNATGVDVNTILYGETKHRKLKTRDTLHHMIDKADNEELKMYYKCATSIRECFNKKNNRC